MEHPDNDQEFRLVGLQLLSGEVTLMWRFSPEIGSVPVNGSGMPTSAPGRRHAVVR